MESRWEVRRLATSTKLALANALKKLLQKKFLDRYDVAEVLRQNHLTAEQIAGDVAELLCSESK